MLSLISLGIAHMCIEVVASKLPRARMRPPTEHAQTNRCMRQGRVDVQEGTCSTPPSSLQVPRAQEQLPQQLLVLVLVLQQALVQEHFLAHRLVLVPVLMLILVLVLTVLQAQRHLWMATQVGLLVVPVLEIPQL